MNRYFVKQSGVTIVEVLIALGIILSMIIVVGLSVNTFVDARRELLNDTKSLYLAEEGYEILRALRDDDWTVLEALVIGDTYYLDVSTTAIAISGTPEIIDGEFYRSFVFNDVYRDADDDITASTTAGATVDNEVLGVTVSVFGPSGTSSLSAILTNLHAI